MGLTPFHQAIQQQVRPGDVVLDLGAGTGVLSILACKAGARQVYAIEKTDMIRWAEKVSEDNDCLSRITFMKGNSTEISTPEKVDVIVAEVIGNFGLDENLLSALTDARDRFLKAGGRLIPAAVNLVAAPIESEKYYGRIEFFDDGPYGLDFRSMKVRAANQIYYCRFRPESLLSEPQTVMELDLYVVKDEPPPFETLTYKIKRDGLLHGIAGWFDATLAEGIDISSSPLGPKTSWRHVFLPIVQSVRVREGNVLAVDVSWQPPAKQLLWHWEFRLYDSDEKMSKGEPRLHCEQSNLMSNGASD